MCRPHRRITSTAPQRKQHHAQTSSPAAVPSTTAPSGTGRAGWRSTDPSCDSSSAPRSASVTSTLAAPRRSKLLAAATTWQHTQTAGTQQAHDASAATSLPACSERRPRARSARAPLMPAHLPLCVCGQPTSDGLQLQLIGRHVGQQRQQRARQGPRLAADVLACGRAAGVSTTHAQGHVRRGRMRAWRCCCGDCGRSHCVQLTSSTGTPAAAAAVATAMLTCSGTSRCSSTAPAPRTRCASGSPCAARGSRQAVWLLCWCAGRWRAAAGMQHAHRLPCHLRPCAVGAAHDNAGRRAIWLQHHHPQAAAERSVLHAAADVHASVCQRRLQRGRVAVVAEAPDKAHARAAGGAEASCRHRLIGALPQGGVWRGGRVRCSRPQAAGRGPNSHTTVQRPRAAWPATAAAATRVTPCHPRRS